eukprot:911609-Rhodomonas_salina.3
MSGTDIAHDAEGAQNAEHAEHCGGNTRPVSTAQRIAHTHTRRQHAREARNTGRSKARSGLHAAKPWTSVPGSAHLAGYEAPSG